MKWLSDLERRFDFLVIPQFPLFIASATGLIYLLGQAQPIFVERLVLDPAMILSGEWWRVFTFLFVPPQMSPIFLVFWLLLLYQIAQTLEQTWGEFHFFLFYFLGATATVLAALLIIHQPIGNVSLNTTLFLAYATLYPDIEFLIFFILPVKVKYLAWLAWLMIAVSWIWGSFASRVASGASLTNYALFFGPDIWNSLRLKWNVYQNRRRFRS